MTVRSQKDASDCDPEANGVTSCPLLNLIFKSAEGFIAKHGKHDRKSAIINNYFCCYVAVVSGITDLYNRTNLPSFFQR